MIRIAPQVFYLIEEPLTTRREEAAPINFKAPIRQAQISQQHFLTFFTHRLTRTQHPVEGFFNMNEILHGALYTKKPAPLMKGERAKQQHRQSLGDSVIDFDGCLSFRDESKSINLHSYLGLGW